ncbi:hypothetical protein PFISCL1PPCAC_23977, partial [Pristionchus fissidentatus]
ADRCVTHQRLQITSTSHPFTYVIRRMLSEEECLFHSIQLRIDPPSEKFRGNALWMSVDWEGAMAHPREFEVYELVIRDGIEYRIPRHRKEQNLFVSARNSGFLLVIEGKGYASEQHLEIIYSICSA